MFGRREIFTAQKVFTPDIVAQIISDAMPVHIQNAADCQKLIDYYCGNQPILDRVKEVRSDIVHNMVANYAYAITNELAGYDFSQPLTYTIADGDKMKSFDEMARMITSEQKSSVDFAVKMNAAITGHGFMTAYSDVEVGMSDDCPIEYVSLDPRTTFVVRESSTTRRIMLGVTYYDIEEGNDKVRVYDARTADEVFIFRGLNGKMELTERREIMFPVCPIVEYKNNQFLLGCFEPTTTILDAINTLASNSLEDIEQHVQSLLVFVNAQVTDKSFEKLIKDKFAVLINTDGLAVDAKYIANQLNPESTRQLRDYYLEVLQTVCAIPDRRQTPSDTGMAVALGNGYPAQENAAKARDMLWYQAERDMIKLTLGILHKKGVANGLTSLDIKPMIKRALMETAQMNAQSIAALENSTLYAPEDKMMAFPLTSDIVGSIRRGKEFFGDKFGGKESELSAKQQPNKSELSAKQ